MIKLLSFRFSLFDAFGNPIDSLPVTIQYFNTLERNWVGIYNYLITGGQFLAEEKATSRNKSLKLFLQKIKSNEIPKLRIVPDKPLFDSKKQEVLSMAYAFEFAENDLLKFDFGKAWILDKGLLEQNDSFQDFIGITSSFPLVNQNLSKIQTLEKELSAQNALNQKLESQLQKAEAASQSLSDKNHKIATELKSTQSQLKQQEALLLATQTELETAQNSLKSKEEENRLQSEAKDLEKRDFEAQIKRQNDTLVLLQNEKQAAQLKVDEIEGKQQHLIRENQALQASMQAITTEKQTLEAQIDALAQNIDIENRPIAVKSLYKNLVDEIDKANELSQNNRFSLANISIKLKGVINQDAKNNVNIQLFTKENLDKVNGNTVSDIAFDMVPIPNTSSAELKAPDLRGLTETAASRVLNSLGLRLNPVYQNNPMVPLGAAFKQSPDKGVPILPNAFVTVIFSKNE